MGIDKVSVIAQWNLLYYAIVFMLLAAYTLYIYKFTIPAISQPKKILFIVLRTLAIVILLFLAFEPILTIIKKHTLQPLNLVFVDNSKSMLRGNAGKEKRAIVNDFVKDLKNQNIKGEWEYYSFGENVKKISPDSVSYLNFGEAVTNFADIFKTAGKANRGIASITIVSDGVITEGSNPSYTAEKMGVPVFTIAVGDTSKQRDISVEDIKHNEYIYSGIETAIRCALLSTGYDNFQCSVRLFEENALVQEQTVVVREGANSVIFNYKPKSSGEKKMTILVAPVQSEKNKENNTKVFFLKIQESKLKVLLVTGSLTNDYSFVKQALAADTNVVVKSIIEIGQNKYMSPYSMKDVDSSGVYFFIDYPSQNSASPLYDALVTRIKDRHKPVFILGGESISYNLLKQLEDVLPVKITRQVPGSLEIQPYVNNAKNRHPLLHIGAGNGASVWEDLPPALRANNEVAVKAESEILLKTKIKTQETDLPLLIIRNIGSQRSVMLLASEIYRWRLQRRSEAEAIFNGFFNNVLKWLYANNERERFICNPSKKVYGSGEKVEFIAELYDESFNADNAGEITVDMMSGKNNSSVTLTSVGNGMYEGTLDSPASGDYMFTAKASSGDVSLKKSGRFSIGGFEVEYARTGTDVQTLQSLSNISNGTFFLNQEYAPYFDMLKKIQAKSNKDITVKTEFVLWNNYWALIIIILLFCIEWFLRKREGMI